MHIFVQSIVFVYRLHRSHQTQTRLYARKVEGRFKASMQSQWLMHRVNGSGGNMPYVWVWPNGLKVENFCGRSKAEAIDIYRHAMQLNDRVTQRVMLAGGVEIVHWVFEVTWSAICFCQSRLASPGHWLGDHFTNTRHCSVFSISTMGVTIINKVLQKLSRKKQILL